MPGLGKERGSNFSPLFYFSANPRRRESDIDLSALSDKHPFMAFGIDLQQMTTADKLRLMEALWQDLSTTDADVVSPEWHRDVLAERDRLIESGEENFIDWEIAKKQLREELQ